MEIPSATFYMEERTPANTSLDKVMMYSMIFSCFFSCVHHVEKIILVVLVCNQLLLFSSDYIRSISSSNGIVNSMPVDERLRERERERESESESETIVCLHVY
jgi:hypothetical protein